MQPVVAHLSLTECDPKAGLGLERAQCGALPCLWPTCVGSPAPHRPGVAWCGLKAKDNRKD